MHCPQLLAVDDIVIHCEWLSMLALILGVSSETREIELFFQSAKQDHRGALRVEEKAERLLRKVTKDAYKLRKGPHNEPNVNTFR